MDVKAKWDSLVDKWEAFRGNPLKTHVAAVFVGVVLGAILASLK